MSFYKFLLVFYAMVAFTGCQDGRVDVYVHEATGCQSDEDCAEGEFREGLTWCEPNENDGTCYIETTVYQPGCYVDLDCEDDDIASLDACVAGGCQHIFTNVIEIPSCYSDSDCDDGDTSSIDMCTDNGCHHVVDDGGTPLLLSRAEGGDRRITIEPDSWQLITNVNITAYNITTQAVSGIYFYGRNLQLFSEVALFKDGLLIASAVPTGSQAILTINLALPSGTNALGYQLLGKVDREEFLVVAPSDPETMIRLGGINVVDYAMESFVLRYNDGMRIRFRDSLPIVTPQPLATTVLTNSRQDLHKVQISAQPQGAITLRAISYRIGVTSGLGTLSNFRVRRGSVDMPLDSYQAFNGTTDEDLETGVLQPIYGASNHVTVAFDPPITVVGAGEIFTLHAETAGFVTGDSMYVQMADSFVAAQDEGACGVSPGTIVAGNGTIHREAIVWNDEIHPNSCFGSLNTGSFWFSNSLTR